MKLKLVNGKGSTSFFSIIFFPVVLILSSGAYNTAAPSLASGPYHRGRGFHKRSRLRLPEVIHTLRCLCKLPHKSVWLDHVWCSATNCDFMFYLPQNSLRKGSYRAGSAFVWALHVLPAYAWLKGGRQLELRTEPGGAPSGVSTSTQAQ